MLIDFKLICRFKLIEGDILGRFYKKNWDVRFKLQMDIKLI